MPSSLILDILLPAPQYYPGIWRWWIAIFFGSIFLSMLPLTSVLFCVYRIVTGNETGIASDALGDSLYICGTIISILNWYPISPLNK